MAYGHSRSTAVTWNREISRIFFDKCVRCHRPGGTAFSLLTFLDAQPRGNAIKQTVVSRQMPPWGAVKGFGQFRNDESLSQEQIDLVARWVNGGIRRGNNPNLLPKMPEVSARPGTAAQKGGISVSGHLVLKQTLVVDGLMPERLGGEPSMQVTARLPSGQVVPLVWLHGYDSRYPHPFLFREPIRLPPGTVIQGVPNSAVVSLIPG